jgi:anti-sigma factor RsiW
MLVTSERQAFCPPAMVLSEWLDDQLPDRESNAIRSHLDACAVCRGEVLGWVHSVRQLTSLATVPEEPGTGCPGAESLVVYTDGEAAAADAALEAHLQACARCVGEVQRLITLRVALETAPGSVTNAPVAPSLEGAIAPHGRYPWARALGLRAIRWRGRWREVVRSSRHILARPWPTLGAVAATAVLAIVVVRFVPFGTNARDVGFRGVQEAPRLEVRADSVARARPGDDEPILATLSRGTIVTRLEESGEWTRVELADGRRVWMRTVQLTNAAGGGTHSQVNND